MTDTDPTDVPQTEEEALPTDDVPAGDDVQENELPDSHDEET